MGGGSPIFNSQVIPGLTIGFQNTDLYPNKRKDQQRLLVLCTFAPNTHTSPNNAQQGLWRSYLCYHRVNWNGTDAIFLHAKTKTSRSPWPCGIRRGSAAAVLLGLQLESRQEHGCPSLVSVVSSLVKVSATGRFLVKGIPTESVCMCMFVCVCVCVCVCVYVCVSQSVISKPQQQGCLVPLQLSSHENKYINNDTCLLISLRVRSIMHLSSVCCLNIIWPTSLQLILPTYMYFVSSYLKILKYFLIKTYLISSNVLRPIGSQNLFF